MPLLPPGCKVMVSGHGGTEGLPLLLPSKLLKSLYLPSSPCDHGSAEDHFFRRPLLALHDPSACAAPIRATRQEGAACARAVATRASPDPGRQCCGYNEQQ